MGDVYPENDLPGGHYGQSDVEKLYARVWGDSIHFGYYTTPKIDIEAAVIETKRQMASLAGITAESRILEVASGWGATSRYIARAYGAKLMATNLETSHVHRARIIRDLSGLSSLIDVAEADYHRIPFGQETFDIWWCQEAVVHAGDKPRVFSEAWRVLRRGGRIVFTDQTTERSECEPAEKQKIAERHGSGDLYGDTDFLQVLSDAGFQNVRSLDWSKHMRVHLENMLERIDTTRESLGAEIDPRVFRYNEDMWRFASNLACEKKIGWSCFVAEKP